jgi:hypothetical protein
MSLEFTETTTARIEYLSPADVDDIDPAEDTPGLAGLSIGGTDGVLITGTPSDLRAWLTAAVAQALVVIPTDTGGPWWVHLDRQHHPDVAVGPFHDEAAADAAYRDSPAVNALCERDCVDATLAQGDPEPDRVRLRPDGTPHTTAQRPADDDRSPAYTLAARGHDGRAVAIAQAEHHTLAY